MQVAWRGRSHLEPPARAQVAHVLQPSRQVWRGGQVAWRGAKPPGATRAVTWPQAAFGIYSRCFLHCFAHVHRRRKPSAPGAFCTVLSMSTGGVSHLLQVLFGLFCSWSKWLKPPAFCAKSCKGLVEARGAFRVCLVQNPAFCGFQVARRDSGGVEPPTWAHLCTAARAPHVPVALTLFFLRSLSCIVEHLECSW